MKLKKMILGLIGFSCCFTLLGCDFDIKEVGDYNLQAYGDDAYKFVGLTESGKEKEILVLPESYEEKRIILPTMTTSFAHLNGNFKKMFLPAVYDKYYYDTSISSTFENYKVLMICAKSDDLKSGDVTIDGDPVYLPSKYKEFQNTNHWTDFEVANVSYYYNYEGAPNDNYYWIDDDKYGEKLTFIPQNPLREGYIFNGWYKEKECINPWNYEKDTLPEVLIEDSKIVYQETSLYAKWTEVTPYIRDTIFTITDEDIWEQSHDVMTIKELTGYTAKELLEQDYTKITVKFDFRMWEVNDGYQYLFIYNGTDDTYKCFYWKEYEHGGPKKNKEAKFVDSIILEFDLADFVNDDKLYVYYGANGIGADNWKNDCFTAKWYDAQKKS